MPDATDLAATLRQVDVMTHSETWQFLRRNAEAIATALERGAAAEKALATQRALDDASGFEDEYVLESMRYRKVDALAAYDALTE